MERENISDERYHIEFRAYFWKFKYVADNVLTDEEVQAIEEWEKENLDGGTISTGDCPLLKKYIGPPPWEIFGELEED